jgi:signal transduction histidine kinase
MSTDTTEIAALIKRAREICHEINQPLTVIFARTELLLMKHSPDDPIYGSLEQIRQNAQKLTRLVESLHHLIRDFKTS